MEYYVFMKKSLIIKNSEQMIDLGEKIGRLAIPNMVITMEGDLGAGKTTMTKGIAKGLGIDAIINSPTFTIMKTYKGKLDLYHLDVYRIENAYADFELEEYFDLGGVCVIEWANQVKELLPGELFEIEIKDLGDDQREVLLSSNYEKYQDIILEVIK